MQEIGHNADFNKIKQGDIVCYNKSEDVDQCLIFARVEEKIRSDFMVMPANSDAAVRMSKQ